MQTTWIDTDIGDDVDDAFALALATRLPGLHLAGVSTVSGPVEQRAALARHILLAAGRPDVPVFAGSSVMSDGKPGSAKYSGPPIVQHSTLNTQHSTLNTQHSTLIIALGPLTNIALALRADPALAQRARLVLMGGKLGLPYPDWNLRCDPGAARMVLASGMAITMVGMDLTLRTKLGPARTRRLFERHDDPLALALGACVLAWRTWKRRMPFLHDVLALAIAADPSLARLEARRVAIGPLGFSRAERHGMANALVAVDFDQARFVALLNRHLFGASPIPELKASPLIRLV